MIDDASEGERAVKNDAQTGDVAYAPEDVAKFYAGEITEDELKATQDLLEQAEEDGGPAEVQATEAAIAHAEALGIDISTIQGTGAGGRITKADVEAASAAKETPPSP